MLRFVNICLVLGLVALAYGIYQVKYEARGLDADIASLGKKIDEERDSIAVLRAEWSLLNRPERIERLAQKYLKLAPAKPFQLVTLAAVTDRDFDHSRLEVAAPAPEAKSAKTAVKSTGAAAPAANETVPWPEAKVVPPVEASAQ